MLSENAPVAQLDRASDYESEGRTFESFRARQHLAGMYRAKKLPCFTGFARKWPGHAVPSAQIRLASPAKFGAVPGLRRKPRQFGPIHFESISLRDELLNSRLRLSLSRVSRRANARGRLYQLSRLALAPSESLPPRLDGRVRVSRILCSKRSVENPIQVNLLGATRPFPNLGRPC
jgi:hypothetical protein